MILTSPTPRRPAGRASNRSCNGYVPNSTRRRMHSRQFKRRRMANEAEAHSSWTSVMTSWFSTRVNSRRKNAWTGGWRKARLTYWGNSQRNARRTTSGDCRWDGVANNVSRQFFCSSSRQQMGYTTISSSSSSLPTFVWDRCFLWDASIKPGVLRCLPWQFSLRQVVTNHPASAPLSLPPPPPTPPSLSLSCPHVLLLFSTFPHHFNLLSCMFLFLGYFCHIRCPSTRFTIITRCAIPRFTPMSYYTGYVLLVEIHPVLNIGPYTIKLDVVMNINN